MKKAMIKEVKPMIRQFLYVQEKQEPDYSSCLWANFVLDCDCYTLSITSDCGNYNYSWSVTPAESFLKLMSRLDSEYLLNKISNDVFDICQSIMETCSNIVEYYGLQKGENIKIDELIQQINDLDESNPILFHRKCGELIQKFDENNWEALTLVSVVYDYPARAKNIVKVFMEYLQPLLRKELNGN